MALERDTRAATRGRLAALVALALLALPASAAATRVYVTDQSNSAGKIFEYTPGSGGALSPTTPDTVPSISVSVPRQLSVTPDGRFAYTTHAVSADSIDELGLDSAGTLTALTGSPLSVSPHLSNVAAAPNGRDVYFSELTTSGAVLHARIQAGGQLGSLDSVAAQPNTEDVVVTPDGRFVYAASDGGSVSRYTVNGNGTLTAAGTTTVDCGTSSLAVGAASSNCNLRSLAVTPDGHSLFVGDTGQGQIHSFQIDSSTGALTAPSSDVADGGGADIAIAPSGAYLYTTDGDAGVYEFAIGSDSSLTALTPPIVSTGGDEAQGIEVSPDGASAYAVNTGGSVAQYDVGSGGVLTAKSPATVVPTANVHTDLFGAAVQPLQGPIAALTATAAAAERTIDFNASGSTDGAGSITTYAFDFGDGTSSSGGSPTVPHTYASPGTYTATVTLTDSNGVSRIVYTGHSTLVNAAQASQTVTAAAAGTPGGGGGGSTGGTTGTTTPQGNQLTTVNPNVLILTGQGPAPVFGKTLVLTPVVTGVLVKLPGSDEFVPLESVTSIPVGTIVDARKGQVQLTSATDTLGHTQSSNFYGGIFQASQPGGGGTAKAAAASELVEIKLLGAVGPCAKPKAKKSSARAARKRRTRHLWGNGHGSFRTRGHYASATVRGTVWLTKDTCSGTLTIVRRGTVTVNDFVKHKTVKVKAGKHYWARPGKK